MVKHAIRKGTWRKAALTSGDLTVLVTMAGVMALIRAADYAIPPSDLQALEGAGAVWAWPVLLATAVFILAYGAFTKRHFAVWMGHGFLCSVYTGLGVLVTLDAINVRDGFRGAGLVFFVAVFHFLMWLRTGPRPLDGACAVHHLRRVHGPA